MTQKIGLLSQTQLRLGSTITFECLDLGLRVDLTFETTPKASKYFDYARKNRRSYATKYSISVKNAAKT